MDLLSLILNHLNEVVLAVGGATDLVSRALIEGRLRANCDSELVRSDLKMHPRPRGPT